MKVWLALLFGALATASEAQVAPPVHSAQLTALRPVILCTPQNRHEEPAPETEAGVIEIPDEDLVVIAEGQVVPAVLGMAFGVAIVPDHDLSDIRMVTRRPGRKTADVYVSQFHLGEESTNFFSFDVENELVPGIWTFEAWEGNSRLYRVDFQVLPAGAKPDLVAMCHAPTS
jgi:hypothetical protein